MDIRKKILLKKSSEAVAQAAREVVVTIPGGVQELQPSSPCVWLVVLEVLLLIQASDRLS